MEVDGVFRSYHTLSDSACVDSKKVLHHAPRYRPRTISPPDAAYRAKTGVGELAQRRRLALASIIHTLFPGWSESTYRPGWVSRPEDLATF